MTPTPFPPPEAVSGKDRAEGEKLRHSPGNLGRQGYRRLREAADGRLHAVASWPQTYQRLAEDGLVEIAQNRLTKAEFASITREGRLAIVAYEREQKQRRCRLDDGADRGGD